MGLINEWCLPDLEDKIGSNDGGATGSDDGQELDNSKLRTFKDFVSANSDLIDFGDCGNVKSLVMVVNLDSTTQSFLMNNTNGVSASSGTLSYTDFDNAFVDGVDTNTITTGWHCVVITSTTNVACTNLELGHIGATYGDFKCAYLATYSEDLSAAQIQRITEEQLYKVYSRDASATYRYLPPKNSIRDGLIFSHPLMGGGNDISGNSYNGTDTSVDYSTICSNGLPVASYNGSTSKTKHSSDLTLGNVFSFGCWFKTSASQTNKWIMGAYTGGTSGKVTYALVQSANSATQKLSPYCVDSAGHTTTPVSHPESANVINDNKWHRAIVVVNAANGVKMYLDGKISTSTSVNMSGNFNGRQPNIGCSNQIINGSQTDAAFFTGSIRDAFMVNRVLNDVEIDRDYRDTFIN